MRLDDNYLTALPTELALLSQLTYSSVYSNANNNYLKCDESQGYLPLNYCDSSSQNSLSNNPSFAIFPQISLSFPACTSKCDAPVCEQGECTIICGDDTQRIGEHCSRMQQNALNAIAAQIRADRGFMCTAPVIGSSHDGTNCGTFSIQWDADRIVTSINIAGTELTDIPAKIGYLFGLTHLELH